VLAEQVEMATRKAAPNTHAKRPRQALPAFVRQALLARELLAAYDARPAYQRNDYLAWITRAKLPATQQKRLAQMLAELAQGTVYMNMRWQAGERASTSEPIRVFAGPAQFASWLREHHVAAAGIWLKLAKRSGPLRSLDYARALDVALAWGWIDAQKRPFDGSSWLQRFTPRKPRSRWSKINRDKALALQRAGKLEEPGRLEVERAQRDGRWDEAYDSPRTSEVPADLAQALTEEPRAQRLFGELDSANRYAVLYRVQAAKKPETRARRIATLVAMLARGETIHPARKKRAR
jgi:uncharacterized protein YdeI (YjbR/CyaY-like superfamily)